MKEIADKEKISHLATALGIEMLPQHLSGVDVFMPFLERMRQDGAVVAIKLDGQRTGVEDAGPYTVIVTAPFIPGDFFRTDAHSIEDALVKVIVLYGISVWKV